MKYLPLNSNLFIKNRAEFAAQMQANSLAVFNSNDIYPISADSTMPFEQHRDIFFLSGVDQEESVLVLFPDCPKAKHREKLFRVYNEVDSTCIVSISVFCRPCLASSLPV